ncbi:hypothetical protein [Paraburkholderia sp. RL17-373-BIF-A]|uniref:hypothetical protein n=1 Tax=Paraburkholderia sp. RL17-373-BIF-A TaxID=3031629 RepID=UPI0038B82287
MLSILTFGIYAFAKSSQMNQKRTALEGVVKDLHQQMTNYPDATTISVEVDGKKLTIEEQSDVGDDRALKIRLDGEMVGIIKKTSLASFRESLGTEITLMSKRNEQDISPDDRLEHFVV